MSLKSLWYRKAAAAIDKRIDDELSDEELNALVAKLPSFETIRQNIQDSLQNQIPMADLTAGSDMSALVNALAANAFDLEQQLTVVIETYRLKKVPKL